jgi:hypothetical protein
MTFGKDPVLMLTVFVLTGFIISVFTFSDNTKTPLKSTDQPQYYLVDTQ